MKSKKKKTGLPPGSVVFTGNRKVEKIAIQHLEFDANLIQEKKLDNHHKITFHQSEVEIIDWYDIRGLHDTKLIETIGSTFKVHVLAQEDIVDIQQRPKFEEYEEGVFIIVRALSFNKPTLEIKTEQVSIFFREGLVLTFQETESDLFSTIRERIHNGRGRIRDRKADYLVYALIDVLVDQFFVVLENIEEEIEKLEDSLNSAKENNIRKNIYHLKRELIFARKNIYPLREAVSKFAKSETSFVNERTSVFLRDLQDHLTQLIETIDNYRENLNSLQDLNLSEISFKMNQIMQVLTIITTIFVPLSFLAGLYGMNFDNIPELHLKYGYFILLAVMLIIAGSLIIWFKNKKWL